MSIRENGQWPGREGGPEDDALTPLARLTGRKPRLATSDGQRVLPGLPSPDPHADWTEIPTPDGGVVVRMGGPELLDDDGADDTTGEYDEDFYDNLALQMDDSALGNIANELIEAIEADIRSRATWMANYERGMSLLGLEQKQPSGAATAEGVSKVDHPLLLEACILTQSNECAELLPAAGPVKIDNGGQETAITDTDAQQLEKDFNQYLTVHRPEYYPDTERLIFQKAFGGMGFKKVFHCPIRRAPVSDTVEPGDLIVPNNARSLDDAGRITHRIKMRPALMKRMQYVGAYRDCDLQTPVEDVNGIERKTMQISGIKPQSERPEDVDFTLYECSCEIDMPGDEHKENGKPTGLPRPYIVTIEKDTRQVLEIRRNWVDGDELFTLRRRFIAYSFIPMFGFYASGLLTVLGNTTSALTAAWRMMLDAGMFSNFPGGMYLKSGNRQLDNNFRAAPGEWVPIDGNGTDDIRKFMTPFPYKEPGPASQQFVEHIGETGQRVGGTANIPVAEGKADAPVGTVLAALEQVSKMISAVHRRAHQSQSLEFQTLLQLIREKPEDFVKYFEAQGFWTVDRLRAALDNWSLIPRADPNTPTQMHRIIKMTAVKQLEQLAPDRYDGRKVDERILRVLGIDDPQELFAPPAAPGAVPPDPTLAVATIVQQTEAQKTASKERVEMTKAQLAAQKLQQDAQLAADKLASTEAVAALKEQKATEREAMKLHASTATAIMNDDTTKETAKQAADAAKARAAQKPKPSPKKP